MFGSGAYFEDETLVADNEVGLEGLIVISFLSQAHEVD